MKTCKINSLAINQVRKDFFRDNLNYRKDFCEYPDFERENFSKKTHKLEKLARNLSTKLVRRSKRLSMYYETISRNTNLLRNSNKLIFTTLKDLEQKEVLLYVHFPFCSSQCLFCNIPHLLCPQKKEMIRYIDYLKKELKIYLNSGDLKDKKIKAIFFGGGTPAEMPLSELISFIKFIKSNLKLAEDVDFTIEAHPRIINSSLGKEILTEFKENGVTRISMGIESFDDLVLRLNHRCHTGKEAITAYNLIKKFNFVTNLDMMFGLPGQTYESIKKDLKILEILRPDSIEYFRLEEVNGKTQQLRTINSSLFASDESVWDMNLLIYQWLQKFHYEQNGSMESDNKNYRYRLHWISGVPYIGLGKGAASHLGTLRIINLADLDDYYKSVDKKRLPVNLVYKMTKFDLMVRFFYLRLQLKEGVDKIELVRKFGSSSLTLFNPFIERLLRSDLAKENSKNVRLSKLGAFFVNDISNQLLLYTEEANKKNE